MSVKGTPLYLQVEEALEAFKTGITRLRDQQSQTDSLLAKGNEALDNLMEQVTRIDRMQEDVETDLRLMERFRENAEKERSKFQEQVLRDISQHQEQTKEALGNIRTDLSVRRQELLGMIRDLDANIRASQENSQTLAKEFSGRLETQAEAARIYAEDRVQDAVEQCNELTARIEWAEKWVRRLLWGFIALSILLVIVLIV